MKTATVPIHFTKEQVDNFGKLTGDNGPIHSVQGVVQGGFILSMLPQWLTQTPIGIEFIQDSKQAMSVMLDSKFRNKLMAGDQAEITFTFGNTESMLSKINWKVHKGAHEYCSGKWVIYKSFIDNN
jgi:hypothetical protein